MVKRALIGTLIGTLAAAVGLVLAVLFGEPGRNGIRIEEPGLLLGVGFYILLAWVGTIVCAGPGAFLFGLGLGAVLERLRTRNGAWLFTVPAGMALGVVNLLLVAEVLPVELNGIWLTGALLGGAFGGLGTAVEFGGGTAQPTEEIWEAIEVEEPLPAPAKYFETARRERWRKLVGGTVA